MKTKQSITKKLNVTTDKAWSAISSIGQLDKWFPIISTCRVEGQGVGAHRYMSLEGGGAMTDVIEDVNHSQRRLVYLRIESPFPVTYYRGTVEVFESYDALAIVVWTADFESTPENSVPIATLVKEAISAGIDGMEKDLN